MLRGMVDFKQIYPFKSFKGCLTQILLSPFFNTVSHMYKVQSDNRFKEMKVYILFTDML